MQRRDFLKSTVARPTLSSSILDSHLPMPAALVSPPKFLLPPRLRTRSTTRPAYASASCPCARLRFWRRFVKGGVAA